jgi:hypothetical protein
MRALTIALGLGGRGQLRQRQRSAGSQEQAAPIDHRSAAMSASGSGLPGGRLRGGAADEGSPLADAALELQIDGLLRGDGVRHPCCCDEMRK